MSAPLDEFAKLSRRAAEDLDATNSVRSMEPALVAMLRLVEAHPELRTSFEVAFIEICDSPLPKEIVQFCMRELRWPVIRSHVERTMRATNDPRVHAALQQVLDAYEDEWGDADLFEYYSRPAK